MALIRKHNAGGKADFREFVVTKLLTDETLSAREQENISKELSSFQSSKEGDEDIGDISGGVNDKTATSTWLNNAKKEFDENTPEQVQLMPEGGWGPETRSPEGFGKYLQRTLYGGNEHTLVRAIGSMTDNNKIKQYVIKNAKDYTRDYVNRAYQESIDRPDNEWHNKQEMEQAQNVLATIDETKAINDTDWNAVVDSLRKLGEDPEEFLRSPQQLEAIEKRRKDTEEKANWESRRKSLENLGIDKDLVEQLEGYAVNTDYEPFEDMPFLQDALKKGGYNLIQSKDKTTHALVKDGKIVKDAAGLISDDQLNEHFGKTWGINEHGVFTIFDKENIDANEFFDWDTIGVDEFETQNVGREILTTDPKFAGYKIVGYSGDDQKGFKDTDIFGRRQFTKEFTFTKDGKTFKVIRDDNGVYRREDGNKKFTMPTTMSFGEGIEKVAKDYKKTYFENSGSPLYMLDKKKIPGKSKRMDIPGIPTTEDTLKQAEWNMTQFEKEYDEAIEKKRSVSISPSDNKRLAEFLTHVLTSDAYSEEQKEQAEKLVHRQAALAIKKIYDKKLGKEVTLFETPLFMWKKGGIIEPATKFDPEKFRKWKEGGVLKAEKGSSLTDFYKASSELSKSRPAAAESSVETGDGAVSSGYHDPAGTVGDSNFLDWVSLGGTALAFVPVVGGVVGGAVSTLADLGNAALRGEWTRDDSKKLLSNIGFTALSAIGLGAAKGINMAGKSARVGKGLWGFGKAGKAVKGVKTMGTAEKVARVAKTASARAKIMGPSGKSVVKAADRLGDLTKAANKTGKGSSLISKILKGDKQALADIANSGYTSVEAVLKDYKVVNNLGSVKTTWHGQAGQGVVKGIKNLANLDLTKVGKGIGYGMSAAQIAGGVGSGITIAGNVRDEGHLWKGIKKSKMSDVERLAQSATLGYGWRQNVLDRRAVDRHTKLVYAKKPSVTLSVTDKNGDLIKNIPLKNDASVKKMRQSWLGKKFSSQGKKEMVAIEKDLVNLVKKEDLDLIKKAVSDGGVINPIIKAGVPTKRILIDTKVNMSSPEDVRSFLRAEKVLTRGQGNFFRRSTPQEIFKQSDNTRTLNPKIRNIAKQRKLNRGAKPKKPEVWTQGSLFKKGGIIKHKVGGPVDYKFPWATPTASWWKADSYGTIPTSTVSAVNAGSTKATSPTSTVSAGKAARPTYFWDNPGLIIPKTSRKWGDPSVFNTQITTPTLEDYFARKRNTTLTTPGGYSVQAEKPKYSYNSSINYSDRLNNLGILENSEYPKDPGLLVDQYGHISWDRNKFRHKDLGKMYEAGRLLTSELYNRASAKLRKQGIVESIPKLSGISSSHLRTSTPLTMEAYKQAGGIHSGARRIGRTVNINDSMAAMLTGQKNAAELIMRAASEDANRNRGVQDQQMAVDRDTMIKNMSLTNQQSDIMGKARQALYNEDANLKQKTGENYSAFLAGLKKENADKPRRTLFDRYITEMQDPNIEGAREWYDKMTSDEAIASKRNDYMKIEEAKKKVNINHEIIPYEQSQEYLDYIKHINREVAPISTKMSRLNQIASILSMYSPSNNTK